MELKKVYTARRLICLGILLFFVDLILMGLFHTRFWHASRAGFIIGVVVGSPWWILLLLAWLSGLIAYIGSGTIVDELALAALIWLIAALIVPHTLRTGFVRCVLAGILMIVWMAGSLFMAGSGWYGWTIFQIIANIIIVCGILKYRS